MVPVVARSTPGCRSRTAATSRRHRSAPGATSGCTGPARGASACTVPPPKVPPPVGNRGSPMDGRAMKPPRRSSTPRTTADAGRAQRLADHLTPRASRPSLAHGQSLSRARRAAARGGLPCRRRAPPTAKGLSARATAPSRNTAQAPPSRSTTPMPPLSLAARATTLPQEGVWPDGSYRPCPTGRLALTASPLSQRNPSHKEAGRSGEE